MATRKADKEITVSMAIDVDGAPNSYGPNNDEALDFELNAHVGAKKSGAIVGYRIDSKGKPIVQGPGDPRPGFYISETGYADQNNSNPDDPRRYVNAAEINYTLLASAAKKAGVETGDFCVVHSLRHRLTVFAIVGDTGNTSGAEGSLALLQRLGYKVKNGKAGGEDDEMIVVRYFAESNPDKRFFFTQADLDAAAIPLNLNTDFSDRHEGDPGKLVLDAVGQSETDTQAPRVLPFAPLGDKEEAPPYPGHFIERDSDDVDAVRTIQQRLNDLGFTKPGDDGPQPLTVNGHFGQNTENAVELFQVRHTDLDGNPLDVDGKVGSQTWGALFGRDTVHASPPTAEDDLLGKALEIAAGEIGVREDPPGSNKGERVEQYDASVGDDPGEPWCAAFVYFCFREAAKALGRKTPVIRTGSVLDHWNRARTGGVKTLLHDDAVQDPSKVKPGFIFIISTGGETGHTGLVESVAGGKLVTIEGNTNDDGSREGIGVFRRNGRTIDSINRGFIDYSGTA